MNNLEDQLFLNIHNKDKIIELLNNGAKPSSYIYNSYLDSCSKYNDNKCDIDITKKFLNNGLVIDSDIMINASFKLSDDIDHFNLVFDNFNRKKSNIDDIILDIGCYIDNNNKYNFVRNLLNKHKIIPNERHLSKCIKHNNLLNNTFLKYEEINFNDYFYNFYKNNKK